MSFKKFDVEGLFDNFSQSMNAYSNKAAFFVYLRKANVIMNRKLRQSFIHVKLDLHRKSLRKNESFEKSETLS